MSSDARIDRSRRQGFPENLTEDGMHLRIYGTTYYGRRYLNSRKKLTRGDMEYLAWLKEQRVAEEGGGE
jgi:hypothetical protein